LPRTPRAGTEVEGKLDFLGNTVDFKTIGGDANALSGYPTTHQFLVAEEVPGERCVVDRM
jgi:hypothetical protein